MKGKVIERPMGVLRGGLSPVKPNLMIVRERSGLT